MKPVALGALLLAFGARGASTGASCCDACVRAEARAEPPPCTASCVMTKLPGWALPGNPSARCLVYLPHATKLVSHFVADPGQHRLWVARLGRSDVLAAPPPAGADDDDAGGAAARAPASPIALARSLGAAFAPPMRAAVPPGGRAARRDGLAHGPVAVAAPAVAVTAGAQATVSPAASGATSGAGPVAAGIAASGPAAGAPATAAGVSASAATPAAASPAPAAPAAGGAAAAPSKSVPSAEYYVYYKFTNLVCFKDRDVVARVRVSEEPDGSIRADVRSVPSTYRPPDASGRSPGGPGGGGAARGGDCVRMPYLRIEYRVRKAAPPPATPPAAAGAGVAGAVVAGAVAPAACACPAGSDGARGAGQAAADGGRAGAEGTAVECLLAADFGGGLPRWMASWAVARAETSFTELNGLCARTALAAARESGRGGRLFATPGIRKAWEAAAPALARARAQAGGRARKVAGDASAAAARARAKLARALAPPPHGAPPPQPRAERGVGSAGASGVRPSAAAQRRAGGPARRLGLYRPAQSMAARDLDYI